MLNLNRKSVWRTSFILGITLYAIAMLTCVLGCSPAQPSMLSHLDENMEVSDLIDKPSEEEKIIEAVEQKVSSMSLHDKVSQMVVVRPESINEDMFDFTAIGESNLSAYPFGGVCYFSENLSSPSDLDASIDDMNHFISDTDRIGMFISVDEEGGGLAYPDAVSDVGGIEGVSRIARADFPNTEKMYPMFYYKDAGEDIAYDNAVTIAKYLEEYRFNWDFAPVADVNSNPDNPVIGYRAYSDDWEQTADLVASAVRGYESQNMATSLKHFPGHGDTDTDTHSGEARVDDKDYYQLMSQELVPFKAGIDAGADSVMMGHITVPAIDNVPVSMSSQWIQNILRGEMEFGGVVVTDGLEMGALTGKWSNSEIAVACAKAGCDVLLLPQDPYEAVDAVVAAVESGEIDEEQIDESVSRILLMKNRHGIWNALC